MNKCNDHVAWADYIKSFHSHLQQLMRKEEEQEQEQQQQLQVQDDKRMTTNNNSNTTHNVQWCNTHIEELRQWQTIMSRDNTSLQLYMKYYASAMHHLATQYWSLPSESLNANNKNEVISEEERCEEKEIRADWQVVHCNENKDSNDDNMDTGICTTNIRKCYNDRVELCLECMHDYFIGSFNKISLCNNKSSNNNDDHDNDNDNDHKNTEHNNPFPVVYHATTQSNHSSCTATICMSHNALRCAAHHLKSTKAPEKLQYSSEVESIALFSQLPRIITRLVKPLRQEFYKVHHRVASSLEVEQMIITVLRTYLLVRSKEEPAFVVKQKELSECHMSKQSKTYTDENINVKEEMTCHVKSMERDSIFIALCYIARCIEHRWSKLAHLHPLHELYDTISKHQKREEREEEQEYEEKQEEEEEHELKNGHKHKRLCCNSFKRLPPLRVLDVGSCYGPFCGKSLSHTLLGSVSLEVIAIDLSPASSECAETTSEENVCTTNTLHNAINEEIEYKPKRQRVECNAVASSDINCKREINYKEENNFCCPKHEQQHNSSSVSQGKKVWECDWLSVKFYNQEEEEEEKEKWQQEEKEEEERQQANVEVQRANSYTTITADNLLRLSSYDTYDTKTNCKTHYYISEIAAESFDVVLFCLLLSFMPTPRLRFRACLHAHVALKSNGLLIIVCTRTQGARNGRWVKEWVECIEHIGFTRVHQRVHKQLIIFSFAKNEHLNFDCDNIKSTENYEKWIEVHMQSPMANKLRIIADDKLECL